MSSYRLGSPIDIKSATAANVGVINIYNGATNYTAIQGRAGIGANTPFVLPSAIGTVNQFIRTDGAGNASFQNGLTSCFPISMNFAGATAITPASTTSATFQEVGVVYWQGSVFTTPTAVKVIFSGTAVGAEIRLVNLIPGNTVAILTGVTVTATPTIYNVPVTGGFDAVDRTITVEIRRATSGTLNMWGLQIKV